MTALCNKLFATKQINYVFYYMCVINLFSLLKFHTLYLQRELSETEVKMKRATPQTQCHNDFTIYTVK